MPLTINVGLNRKASEDFQSSGVSINLTAELDQALLSRPEELQQKIEKLYAMANAAVARQLSQNPPSPPPQKERWTKGRGLEESRQNGNAPPRSNGHNARPQHNGNHGQEPRPMTPKQKSAILAICRQERISRPFDWIREQMGRDLDELSAKQASALIDSLKGAAADRN